MAPVLGPIGALADHAHTYTQAGLEIFPVNPRDKTPLVSQHQATTDTGQIAAWWTKWPTALIGHRISADHVILDIDPRHGGLDTWQALRSELDQFPTTRGHASGRGDGGGHTWWLRPSDRLTIRPLNEWARDRGLAHEVAPGKWSAGIDILHRDHRYTILPPSPHPTTGRPYTWINGHGLHIPPAPLPQLLVDLIVDDTPPTPPAPPRPRDPDSIADWYTTNHTWTDLLTRHGWRIVGGDGESDGTRWRHPTATNAFSATIRHSCLFIYSPNTPFDVTEQSDPHGYTLFRAWATLEHAGDLTAAARAAREARDGPLALRDDLSWLGTPSSNGHHPTPEEAPCELGDDFWQARPHLAHIRQAAHSRQRSAEAVLHVTLARISAITPHTVTIPPIVGAAAPLSYFAVVVAAPGIGKSSANQIAAQLVPAPDWVPDQLPLGSGEGLAETLFDLIEETGDDGKTRKVKRQVGHNGFVYADEGQTLAEIGTRNGSTLLPTIRTIWTGGVLGQANASIERRRIVPALTYTFGMCIALQPTRAGALLADVDAGTPQRFGWASAIDPQIPDTPPPWPGPLDWQPPHRFEAGTPIGIDPAIVTEIRTGDLARARGETPADPLDAHAGLYRLKVAGLLAILDGRTTIEQDDWHLANTIKTASDHARTRVAATVAYEAARAEQITSARLARRHTEAQAAEERRKIVDGARKIATKVWAEPERWTVAEARRLPLRHWGNLIEAVIEHAVAESWIVEEQEPGQGTPKRRLKPGAHRP